jgi:hypothetical protein
MKKLLTVVIALTLLSMLGYAQQQQTPPSTTNQLSDDVKIAEGPTIKNLTPTSAVLYWKTNNVAATDVRYGLQQNNPDQRKFERGGAREHTVTLTGLQAGKTYYFYVYDRKGQVRVGGQFTTPTT